MNIINTEDQSFIKNGIAQEEGRLHTRSQVEQCTMHVSSILTKQEDTRRSTGKKIKIWTVSRMKYKRRGTDNFFRNRLKQGSLSSFFYIQSRVRVEKMIRARWYEIYWME